MPRRERPLDADGGALSQFAGDLRRLREKAGSPTYRELGASAHYSAATLSDAAGGRKLPTLAVTLAYVRACAGDVAEWERRWREIADAAEFPSTDSPYVGLSAFQPEDADRFFGRERLTAELTDAVRARRFVGVFGASGSGKSSLLRAGLVPALDVPSVVFTPGVHPLEECAVRLAALFGDSAVRLKEEFREDPAHLDLRIRQHNAELVLVVDQFEEVFTLASDEERTWFVRALTAAPRVVIGVRADFYGHCGRHPELVDAIRGGQILVGPMTPDELRRAITEPAARVGATVETALVARLVADVAGQSAALPLVSHALVETWRRRRGMTLSLAGYEEAGAVEHALSRTAEQVFAAFPPHEQRAARRVFLRLIALGEGTEDTKRRVPLRELDIEETVLDRLARARLVTIDRGSVELTHEALIRSWPRLRDWVAADRESLRVHHRLIEATDAWESDARDPDALYRGVRLAQAKELRGELTGREREFLDESVAADTARQVAERARARQLRRLVSLLTVLVVVLGCMVAYTFAAERTALRQRNEAQSIRVATEAMPYVDGELNTAMRYALAAYALSPTSEATDALLSVNTALKPAPAMDAKEASGRTFKFWPIFVAPRGDAALVPGSDGHHRLVKLWQTGDQEYGSIGAELADAVFSANARVVVTLAQGESAARIRLLSPDLDVREAGVLPPSLQVLELTGDGRRALAANEGRSVWSLVDLADPRRPRTTTLPPHVQSALITQDGRTLVTLTKDSVELWQVLDNGELRFASRFPAGRNWVLLGCSTDGSMLAIGDRIARVIEFRKIINPAMSQRWGTIEASVARGEFAFRDDGSVFAHREGDVLRVWDVEVRDRPKRLASIRPRDGFFRVVYSSDGDEFRSFGVVSKQDGTSDVLRVNRFDYAAHRVWSALCQLPNAELTDGERGKLFGETGPRRACP